MISEEELKKIRLIEINIDEYYKTHSFLKLPTSISIQYLLIHFEYAISPHIYKEEKITSLYTSIDALLNVNKDALMESLNWLGEIRENENNKAVADIDDSIYLSAQEFFELGNAYHGVVSAYTMWSRKLASVRLIDNTTVHFKYNLEQVRYDVLDLKLTNKSRDKCLEEMSEKDYLIMNRAKTIVEKTVKQIDSNNISYSVREVDTEQMMYFISKVIKGFTSIPYDWKVFDISRNELLRFWASLVSIGMLHMFAVHYAFNNFKFKNDLLVSMIIIRPLKDWCKQLSRWSKLSGDKVEQLLNFHIYSSQHQKPDIVLTPFIKISDKHLGVSPSLLITNNFSRNFIKHLAKNYRDEFDINSSVFSKDMINSIVKNINNKNILISTNITLPEQEMPDIDVCLVDEDNQEIMLCECKWTIPAADPNEVGNKINIEMEKLEQMARLKDYCLKNPEKLSEFIGLDNKLIFNKIFFVIVYENHVGSALAFKDDMPAIDMRIFINLINEKNSLGDSFDVITARKYLPEVEKDFKVKEEINAIGEYKIIWTGFYPS